MGVRTGHHTIPGYRISAKITLIHNYSPFESGCGKERYGDPWEVRTPATALKGPCLNRLTNGPYGGSSGARTQGLSVNSRMLLPTELRNHIAKDGYVCRLPCVVPVTGVEPARPLRTRDFKTHASTNFAIPAYSLCIARRQRRAFVLLVAEVGLEPTSSAYEVDKATAPLPRSIGKPRIATHPKSSVQAHHLSCLQISLQSSTSDISLC